MWECLRKRHIVVERMYNLNKTFKFSLEVQLVPYGGKFICRNGSGWLMWVEENIIKDEDAK